MYRMLQALSGTCKLQRSSTSKVSADRILIRILRPSPIDELSFLLFLRLFSLDRETMLGKTSKRIWHEFAVRWTLQLSIVAIPFAQQSWNCGFIRSYNSAIIATTIWKKRQPTLETWKKAGHRHTNWVTTVKKKWNIICCCEARKYLLDQENKSNRHSSSSPNFYSLLWRSFLPHSNKFCIFCFDIPSKKIAHGILWFDRKFYRCQRSRRFFAFHDEFMWNAIIIKNVISWVANRNEGEK